MKTFAEHLRELKRRLMICLAFLLVGGGVGFVIHKQVEMILQRPLGQTLYYSNPAGGLSFVMQISFSVGLLFALPVLLFQLMQFARPALKPIKTRLLTSSIVCSVVLTIAALVYAYFVSLPAALHFLTTFNSPGVKSLISVTDYLRFLFSYVVGTVIAFQLPLIFYFTNKIRRFPPGSLFGLQRPAIVGSIVFAGVITPTVDPINQMLVAIPIIALFELGVASVWLSNRRHKPAISFEIKMPAELVPLVVVESLKPKPKMVTSSATMAETKGPVSRPTRPIQPASPARPVQSLPRPARRLIMDIAGPQTQSA